MIKSTNCSRHLSSYCKIKKKKELKARERFWLPVSPLCLNRKPSALSKDGSVLGASGGGAPRAPGCSPLARGVLGAEPPANPSCLAARLLPTLVSPLSPSPLPRSIPVPPSCWQAPAAPCPRHPRVCAAAVASRPTRRGPSRGVIAVPGVGSAPPTGTLGPQGASARAFLLDGGPCAGVVCVGARSWGGLAPK